MPRQKGVTDEDEKDHFAISKDGEEYEDALEAKKDGGDFSNMYKRRKWRAHTGPTEGPGVTARIESIIQTSWAGRSSIKTYILIIIDYLLQKLCVEMISLEETHSFF